jgi:hypothetical protein
MAVSNRCRKLMVQRPEVDRGGSKPMPVYSR